MSYLLELPFTSIDNLTEETPLTRLSLINRSPEPDESDVPVSADLLIEIQVIDLNALPPDLTYTKIWVNDVLAFDAGSFDPEFAGIGSTYSTVDNRLIIICQPIHAFASEAIVTVRVASRTQDGTESLDSSYVFTVEDRTLPVITTAVASGLKTVKVQFSESVKQVSSGATNDALNPANYSVYPLAYPAVTPAVSSVASLGPSLVEITTAVELSFGKNYSIVATRVEDENDNVITAPNNSAIFTSASPRSPTSRSFSLISMMPRENVREDLTQDLTKFISCLQDVLDLLLWDIDRFGDTLDPDFADEQYLDAMLADLGNPFQFDLSVIDKRRLLRVLVTMYCQKGTAVGIHNAVLFFLGVSVTVTPWSSDALALGESLLGDDWILGPSGSWSLYAFDVASAVILTASQRSRIRDLVEYMKPAHTHFVNLTEPSTPSAPDHLELGVSLLGVTWDLH